jgi:hypothetical protein
MPDTFTYLRFTLSEIRSILLKSREGGELDVVPPERAVPNRENDQQEV